MLSVDVKSVLVWVTYVVSDKTKQSYYYIKQVVKCCYVEDGILTLLPCMDCLLIGKEGRTALCKH